MTDLLWDEFEKASSMEAGVHILRLKGTTNDSLAIANVMGNRPQDSALCVFKSAADAEEYLYNWIKNTEEWEPFGHPDLRSSIEMILEHTEDYNYITLNPPLHSSKSYVVVEVNTFVRSMEESIQMSATGGWHTPEEWNLPEDWDDDSWDQAVGI
jgi:hypothetical protein